MRQRFFLNSKITGTPYMFVSAEVWEIQIQIPYEFLWKDKNVDERTIEFKIRQVLN